MTDSEKLDLLLEKAGTMEADIKELKQRTGNMKFVSISSV